MSTQQVINTLSRAKKTVDNQEWACINIIGPGLRQVTKESCFRILGVFRTREEAEKHAVEYRKIEELYDIYVVSMYEFLPLPHSVEDVGDVRYEQEEINELLAVHEKTRTQADEFNSRVANAKSTGQDSWGNV